MLPIHPLAELFPQGSEDELRTLAQDIKINGFWGAIVTYQNQVLDGRRRQLACQMAGVAPVYREWNGEGGGSPTVFVISANLHRRHLNVAERAIVAVAAKKLLAEEAEERQKATRAKPGERAAQGGGTSSTTLRGSSSAAGKARDQAGKLSGVSGKTVGQAEKVVNKGSPELQQAMREQTISVKKAAAIADLSFEEQIAACQKDESVARRTGVDEDKREEQIKRSIPKAVRQALDLGWVWEQYVEENRIEWEREKSKREEEE